MNEPATAIEPVVREVVVAAPVDTCYRVFVDGFATWWPPEHHIGDERTITDFVLEPFEGGRCYDVDTDGVECQWGTVLQAEPPDRFVLAWHIQGDWTIDLDPQLQSEVEVRFSAVDDTTTQVRLEHRNLERHGSGAAGLRAGVSGDGGWGLLIGRFSDVVEGRPARPLPPPSADAHPQ
jgi:uncharacterized protein YndB with AHSA1/START domain